jgi:hypothetical protein
VTDERLYDFFVLDDRARLRTFWISLTFGTVAGMVSILSGDGELVFVGVTLLVAIACLAIRLWLYKKAENVQQNAQITRRRWVLAVSTVVVAILAIIVARLRGKTEGLVSQRIMRALDTSNPAEFLEQAGTVASQAKESGIKADRNLVYKAAQKASEIIRSDPAIANSAVAWTTAGVLASYYSYVTVPNIPVLPQCTNFTPLQGGPDRGRGNEATDLSNCTFSLDGNTLRHAELTRCVIKYRGGPAELNDLTFRNCIFDISLRRRPDSQAAEALIFVSLVTGSQPVRFRYTPSSAQRSTIT